MTELLPFEIDAHSVVITAMGALLGALFGGAVRYGANRTERRVALTINLHAEFHAPAFVELRMRAHDALARHSGGAPTAYEASDLAERQAIYAVLHYFERAALLLRTGMLDLRLLRRFLRQYIAWWRPLLCGAGERALDDPEWGETLNEIDWLFDQIGEHGAKTRR